MFNFFIHNVTLNLSTLNFPKTLQLQAGYSITFDLEVFYITYLILDMTH